MGALLVAAGALAGSVVAAGELRIEMTLADDGRLDVRYTPPPGVRELRFVDGGSGNAVFRAPHWQAADHCAELAEKTLRLRDEPGCTALHFRITPVLLARQRTYEGAQPFGGGKVIAYAGFYLAVAPGHAMRWRWTPPPGGWVVHGGRLAREPVEVTLDEAGTAAALALPGGGVGHHYGVLGRGEVESSEGLTLVTDAGIDAARTALVRDALRRSTALLGRSYGLGPGGPAAVVITASTERGFHGDTTDGRMMRLRLPTQSEPGFDDVALARFVAHEAVHWWNTGVFRTDHSRPWLHEGHADWAALLLLHGAGLIDAPRLNTTVAAAFNRCRQEAGSQPAAEALRRSPYACGMTLMAVAQAARRARAVDDAGVPALAVLATLHRREERFDEARFVAWADAGDPQADFARLLADARSPLAAALAQRLVALDLVRVVPLEVLGPALPLDIRQAIAGTLLQALMRADCGGAVDFFLRTEHVELGTRARCGKLPPGLRLVRVQSHGLLRDPVAAWQAARAACEAGQPLTVASADGPEIATACPPLWPDWPQSDLWQLTPQALSRLGLACG